VLSCEIELEAIGTAPFRDRSHRTMIPVTHKPEDDQHADEAGEGDRVEEYLAQDLALVAEPVGRGRGHDDRLRVDHLAHQAARGVGRPIKIGDKPSCSEVIC